MESETEKENGQLEQFLDRAARNISLSLRFSKRNVRVGMMKYLARTAKEHEAHLMNDGTVSPYSEVLGMIADYDGFDANGGGYGVEYLHNVAEMCSRS